MKQVVIRCDNCLKRLASPSFSIGEWDFCEECFGLRMARSIQDNPPLSSCPDCKGTCKRVIRQQEPCGKSDDVEVPCFHEKLKGR